MANQFQKDILDFVLSADHKTSTIINSSAGSGKSTLLLLIASELEKNGHKGRIVCFNNQVAAELTAKLKANSVNEFSAITFHSLGRNFLERKFGCSLKVCDNLATAAMTGKKMYPHLLIFFLFNIFLLSVDFLQLCGKK